VGIGTTRPSHLIQLAGGAYSDGSTWNPASSIRWKENITPLTDGIETLKQLHPVRYNYKKTPTETTMGFIAEEVGKVLPMVVDWDPAELNHKLLENTSSADLFFRGKERKRKENQVVWTTRTTKT
jgi:hypothetical protein